MTEHPEECGKLACVASHHGWNESDTD